MRRTNVPFTILFLLGIGLSGVNAQEAITASGGNATGNGGSASYSVGQLFYTTHNGSGGSVAEGVQQIYEISVESGLDQMPGIALNCVAYPNPATDYLVLKIDDLFEAGHALYQKDLSFRLYDINGKLLQNKIITANETTISMAGLAGGTYFVKVLQAKHTSSEQEMNAIKTFKIIKHQEQ